MKKHSDYKPPISPLVQGLIESGLAYRDREAWCGWSLTDKGYEFALANGGKKEPRVESGGATPTGLELG